MATITINLPEVPTKAARPAGQRAHVALHVEILRDNKRIFGCTLRQSSMGEAKNELRAELFNRAEAIFGDDINGLSKVCGYLDRVFDRTVKGNLAYDTLYKITGVNQLAGFAFQILNVSQTQGTHVYDRAPIK